MQGLPKLGYESIAQLKHKLGHEAGWDLFRKTETESITDICSQYKDTLMIFTPGGGAVAHNQGIEYRKRNIELLSGFGVVVYILPYVDDLLRNTTELTRRVVLHSESEEQRPGLLSEDDIKKAKNNPIVNKFVREFVDHYITTNQNTANSPLPSAIMRARGSMGRGDLPGFKY